MMNLFDLSTGMAGTKKAFRDGSIGGRNRSAVATKTIDPVEIHSEDKPGRTHNSVTCESRKGSSGKKSSTTPMKMLIAQEMSKETDTRRKTPNVIARLMGLDDTLPSDPSVTSAKRNLPDVGTVQSNLEARGIRDTKPRQVGYINRMKSRDLQFYCNENKDYRDVHEVRRQSSRSYSFDDQLPKKVLHHENQNNARMALLREKFIEAKRLATDEKLLDSKEFHDALEVLSSNHDLFLKFLEEPNSLFPSYSEEHHLIPSPPNTKRITVLRPSKTNDTKSKTNHRQGSDLELQNTIWNSGFAQHPMTEKLSQPTRIVVLKPSPRKHLELKSPKTPIMSSPELPRKGDNHGGLNPRDPIHLIEPNKEMKLHIPESQGRHRRDESLLSSVFSNGYVGDDSSFNQSENYAGDDRNNSDSEISSSWDFMSNRYGSPYSHSSLSRASHSPESSSVIREAKKRLSERWALVASNGLYQEKIQGRRSSSTLGEMLSINELKMEEKNGIGSGDFGVRSCGREDEFRTKEEIRGEGSCGNLSRSKSVPSSSPNYGNVGSNTAEDSDSRTDKAVIFKGTTKSRSGKTSFKGRVTSLFFLKNRKSGRDESASSQLEKCENGLQITVFDTVNDTLTQDTEIHAPEVSLLENSEAESDPISLPVAVNDNLNDRKISTEASLSHEELESSSSSENQEIVRIPEKHIENQDHASPTSILDGPFIDEANENSSNSAKFPCTDNPQALSRSTPIESISRTLSWNDPSSEAPLPASFKLSKTISKAGENDPKELILVQNFLTTSGLYKNRLSTIFNGWHSPEIPMDPKLLDEISDGNGEVTESREGRSDQKLIFDCVNLVLREIGRSAEYFACAKLRSVAEEEEEEEALLATEVWPVVKQKLSGGEMWIGGADENGSIVVERMLGREVRGGRWSELMQSEISAISMEIAGQALDELVGETLVGMIDC